MIRTKKAAGVFYHNYYESVFNMGCEKSNYWPRYTYWQADGGDIDLFLLGGNAIARVLDNYTLLTGRPMLLPKRALGYQGSSMFYAELEKDSDQAVLDFIDTAREEGFPIDGFHLSSGLYSLEYEASVTGAPIMRPLVYEFQNDARVYDAGFDYLFGKSILVANVLEQGAAEREVYLPSGTKWYHWEDHFAMYEGGQQITIPVSRSSIPMFFREGAIVPMSEKQIYSMERDPVTALRLILVPGQNGYFCHYDDDGVTESYKNGNFRKTEITMRGINIVEVSFRSQGAYRDTVETVLVEMVKKERSPDWVELNGERIPRFLNRKKFEASRLGWYYSLTNRAVEIRYKNPKVDTCLRVCFGGTDLIGM